MQFEVYISDTPVTLKQSQDQKIYNDNVDSMQGYNHTKFERSWFNGVREKANVKVFSNEKICDLSSFTCVQIKNSGVCLIYSTHSTIVKTST